MVLTCLRCAAEACREIVLVVCGRLVSSAARQKRQQNGLSQSQAKLALALAPRQARSARQKSKLGELPRPDGAPRHGLPTVPPAQVMTSSQSATSSSSRGGGARLSLAKGGAFCCRTCLYLNTRTVVIRAIACFSWYLSCKLVYFIF